MLNYPIGWGNKMPEDFGLKESFIGGIKAALNEALLPGETIRAALNGLRGQAVALTDRRVIIFKAGAASGAMLGHKAKGFPLELITSVEYSCGLTEGRIQLTVAGSVEQRQGWMSSRSFIDQVAAGSQAENVCQFPSGHKQQFQELARIIQAASDAKRAAPVVATAQDASIPEQIKRLAELLQQSILTQEEFDDKKKDLLARL